VILRRSFATTTESQLTEITQLISGQPLRTGEPQEWLGCDLYTFRRGLIVMKDTYVKVVV